MEIAELDARAKLGNCTGNPIDNFIAAFPKEAAESQEGAQIRNYLHIFANFAARFKPDPPDDKTQKPQQKAETSKAAETTQGKTTTQTPTATAGAKGEKGYVPGVASGSGGEQTTAAKETNPREQEKDPILVITESQQEAQAFAASFCGGW